MWGIPERWGALASTLALDCCLILRPSHWIHLVSVMGLRFIRFLEATIVYGLCLRSFPPPMYFEWKLEYVNWGTPIHRITVKGQLSKTIRYILWFWMQSSTNKFGLPVGPYRWVGVFGGLTSADIWQPSCVKGCLLLLLKEGSKDMGLACIVEFQVREENWRFT